MNIKIGENIIQEINGTKFIHKIIRVVGEYRGNQHYLVENTETSHRHIIITSNRVTGVKQWQQ